jgi:hypothetical protein
MSGKSAMTRHSDAIVIKCADLEGVVCKMTDYQPRRTFSLWLDHALPTARLGRQLGKHPTWGVTKHRQSVSGLVAG